MKGQIHFSERSYRSIYHLTLLYFVQVQSSLTTQELQSYGDAGAVAEEVVSSVQTVVAFGGEDKEVVR
jgi:hypothetical protein